MRLSELIFGLTVVFGILPLLLLGVTVAQATGLHPVASPVTSLPQDEPVAARDTSPRVTAIHPQPPGCVLRTAAQPNARQVIIQGTNLPTTGSTVQFQTLPDGTTLIASSTAVVERSGERWVIDMAQVTVDRPMVPRHVLQARFIGWWHGQVEPMSNWSAPFISADTAATCASTRALVAQRALAAPELDGHVDEWPVGPVAILDARYGTTHGESPSLVDAAATLRLTWDETHLYLAAQVTDDAPLASGADGWARDGIELAIDGNWDRVGPGGPHDHAYGLDVDGHASDFGTPLAGSVVVTQPVPGGYTIEAAIPVTHLLAQPLTGDVVVGFTWALRDNDDGGDWDSWLIWSGDETLTHYDRFGELYLLN